MHFELFSYLDQYHFDQDMLELYLFLDHWNHQLTYLNNLNNSPQEICLDQSLYFQLIPWFQIIDYHSFSLLLSNRDNTFLDMGACLKHLHYNEIAQPYVLS